MTKNTLPAQLRAAAVLVFIESAATLGLALFFVWGIDAGQAIVLPTMFALVGFFVAAAAWLVWLGVGLLKVKRSARTPVVFWQLILLLLAGGQFSGKFANYSIGLALLVPAVAVIVLLSNKTVSALFKREL